MTWNATYLAPVNGGTPWIGVDLDGTLAHYDGWQGHEHIGAPVPAMLARVQQWLADGEPIRIFTARVSIDDLEERTQVIAAIQNWCVVHLGHTLPITCVKDFSMRALYDDRAFHVRNNTGEVVE